MPWTVPSVSARNLSLIHILQELLINVRSLAGEYLNWKKQSVFAGEGRIRDTEVSREGILELSQILRRGKHSFEEMHRKAEQSVRRRTVIPLEYLFHIKKAGKYLKHCVSLALAAELDRNSGEPVSYTHLDVYKRQPVFIWNRRGMWTECSPDR